MIVYIGGEKMISSEDIVAVFDLQKGVEKEKAEDFLHRSENKACVINLAEEKQKSMIVACENGENRIYLSSVSVQTLFRRLEQRGSIG